MSERSMRTSQISKEIVSGIGEFNAAQAGDPPPKNRMLQFDYNERQKTELKFLEDV